MVVQRKQVCHRRQKFNPVSPYNEFDETTLSLMVYYVKHQSST